MLLKGTEERAAAVDATSRFNVTPIFFLETSGMICLETCGLFFVAILSGEGATALALVAAVLERDFGAGVDRGIQVIYREHRSTL